MEANKVSGIVVENHVISSVHLKRDVNVDLYLPLNVADPMDMSLLLINDGQDLIKMDFENILEELYNDNLITPILCVGLHCGKDRRNEYATADILDYKGRGTKANAYSQFIFLELLPFIRETYKIPSFKEKSFC